MKSSSDRTILVTGGAGYVGSHIALLLMQRGYQVIIVDALLHGQEWPHQWAPFIEGNCGDTAFMQSIFQAYTIDTIIHCAASIEVSESVQQPVSYYLNNVAIPLNILQLMIHFKIPRIIFSSTCAVYGQPHFVPMTEEHPLAPLSPYGHSKMMTEQIIKDTAQAYGISYAILRYFNAAGSLTEYGLGEQHQPETHVIPRLIESAYSKIPFTLFGSSYNTPDGTCIRDYTHVADIAQAHLQALYYLERDEKSEIFNIGTGKGTSVKELITAVEQATNTKIKIINAPARPGDSPILVADSRKAMALLEWQPHLSDTHLMVQSAAAFMRSCHHRRLKDEAHNGLKAVVSR